MKKLLEQLSRHPKQIFIIDGLGALLSAFMLGIVLVQLEPYFGIPVSTLYFLAFLPCVFALYDLICYRSEFSNIGFFIRIIAFSNLTYCFLSLGLAFYHSSLLTSLGWTYIVLEVIIILIIFYIQLKTVNSIN